MLKPTLKNLINRLWDKFWSGGISNPLNAIEQMTYLLFIKRLDELDRKKLRDKNEGLIEKYDSIFEGYITIPPFDAPISKEELRWSAFINKSADEMLSDMQLKVFPFIKTLSGENSFFTKHMANAVFLIPKPSLMFDAYNTINQIYEEITLTANNDTNSSYEDIQGDVYEYLLEELKTAGKNGQFRTSPHIVQLVIELTFSGINNDEFFQKDFRIADPACGSATFLLGAYKYMLTQFTSEQYIRVSEDGFKIGTIGDRLSSSEHKKLEEDTFFGFDIDSTMVRIGLMNLVMHGIKQPHIDYKDTLSKNYNEESQYRIVLANPPFTGNIDKDDINDSLKLPTNKTELLFIERIHRMLINGGTAGVIVPQGVLFGNNKAFIEARKLILEQSELKAVIAMPSGVFKPYAGVSTAILIFTKGKITNKVWFYDMQSDGYTLDDRRQPEEEKSDLQDIILRFTKRENYQSTDRTGKYFFVPINEIKENKYNLSFNKYKEESYEKVHYDDPQNILKKLSEMEKDIQKEIQELLDIF